MPKRAERADARRNIEAIGVAATACLAADPDASIEPIASAAGVGRMTLYGHFKTRGDLVDAALRSVLDESNELLKATDTRGDPQEALVRLVGASWPLVHRFGNILAAAHREVILGTRLMHAAAEDVAAGRLTADQVPGVLATTLLAAPSPAGSPAPARIG